MKTCKACREKGKLYKEKNKDKAKLYYEANKEKVKQQNKSLAKSGRNLW